MNWITRLSAASLAAAMLCAAASALGVTAVFATPLSQPSGTDVETYLLDEFVRYPGALEMMSDLEQIDLTALSLGNYTQVCTPTMAFLTGEVTQSFSSEIHAIPAWVAPVLTNGEAFSALLVVECPDCSFGWDLFDYYPVDLADGLAGFEPADRLLTHFGEAFFRLRGDDLLPLDPEAWLMLPGEGTLSDYQQFILDSLCPEGSECGDGYRGEREQFQASEERDPLRSTGEATVDSESSQDVSERSKAKIWVLALGGLVFPGVVLLSLGYRRGALSRR